MDIAYLRLDLPQPPNPFAAMLPDFQECRCQTIKLSNYYQLFRSTPTPLRGKGSRQVGLGPWLLHYLGMGVRDRFLEDSVDKGEKCHAGMSSGTADLAAPRSAFRLHRICQAFIIDITIQHWKRSITT